MKRLVIVVAIVVVLGASGLTAALAQGAPGTSGAPAPSAPLSPYASATPPMPQLDAAKSAEVQRQLGLYRSEIDGRVGRGEISAEEAGRLLQWREWQIAQQVAGLAPPPGPIMEEVPASTAPNAYYRPYYAYPQPSPQPYPYAYGYPYYYAPAYRPYYWGASICAGGWGHHGGARVCF
jgi:hypothetical protein